MTRCPNCGGKDVRGGKLTLERPEGSPFATLAVFDFYCFTDGTSESCRTDDPGFDAWYARWNPRD